MAAEAGVSYSAERLGAWQKKRIRQSHCWAGEHRFQPLGFQLGDIALNRRPNETNPGTGRSGRTRLTQWAPESSLSHLATATQGPVGRDASGRVHTGAGDFGQSRRVGRRHWFVRSHRLPASGPLIRSPCSSTRDQSRDSPEPQTVMPLPRRGLGAGFSFRARGRASSRFRMRRRWPAPGTTGSASRPRYARGAAVDPSVDSGRTRSSGQ